MKAYKVIILVTFFCSACNLPSIDNVQLNGEYAIPLINSEITISELFQNTENLDIEVGSDGTIVLNYNAQLFSESISELLPSISSIGEVPILDTVSSISLSAVNSFKITNAMLSGDEIRFRYSHDQEEIVKVQMRIPELIKDGQPFMLNHSFEAIAPLPYTEFTPSIDLDGYEYTSDQNQLTFNYDARNNKGERIKLLFAAMSFNQLTFSYGEGNYPRTLFELRGDSLSLNALEGWKSGQLEFESPSINYKVSHNYGFPIAIQANEVTIHTIDGEVKNLSGDKLGRECFLAFPSQDEIGEVKTTSITFNNENSNINTLFNEKVNFVDYDIKAIINPEDDPDILGYATDESFFEVVAEMILPLKLRMDELILQDTIVLQQPIQDRVSEAELKIITANSYPLKMKLHFIFLDQNNEVVERFLEDEPLNIEPTQEKTRFINLDQNVLEGLRNTDKIIIVSEFDTNGMLDDFATIKEQHKLDLRVGLKFKL